MTLPAALTDTVRARILKLIESDLIGLDRLISELTRQRDLSDIPTVIIGYSNQITFYSNIRTEMENAADLFAGREKAETTQTKKTENDNLYDSVYSGLTARSAYEYIRTRPWAEATHD